METKRDILLAEANPPYLFIDTDIKVTVTRIDSYYAILCHAPDALSS
jgi:hypothetical protein